MTWLITLAKERDIESHFRNINDAIWEAEVNKKEGEKIVRIRICRKITKS